MKMHETIWIAWLPMFFLSLLAVSFAMHEDPNLEKNMPFTFHTPLMIFIMGPVLAITTERLEHHSGNSGYVKVEK